MRADKGPKVYLWPGDDGKHLAISKTRRERGFSGFGRVLSGSTAEDLRDSTKYFAESENVAGFLIIKIECLLRARVVKR
jgi:hypothetical protein